MNDNNNEQKEIKPTLFDNGLPIRPIMTPPFETTPKKDNQKATIRLYLLPEQIALLGNLSVDFVAHSTIYKEIWVAMNNHYLVFSNVPLELVENAGKNEIDFLIEQMAEAETNIWFILG